MLIYVLQTEATQFLLHGPADFAGLSYHQDASFYLNADIEVDATEMYVSKFTGSFFGNGHELRVVGKGFLFAELYGAIFYNITVTISSDSAFVDKMLDAVFMQSRIKSYHMFSTTTKQSYFKSVEFSSEAEMFDLVYDSQFTGCRILGSHFTNLSYGNSYTRIYANLNRRYTAVPEAQQHKFGSLSNTMVFDVIKYSAMILNVTGTSIGNMTLGGLAGQGLSLIVRDSDFASNIVLEKSYGHIGGMFGEVMTNDSNEDVRSFHNITIAMQLKTLSYAEGLDAPRAYRGAIAGVLNYSKIYLLGISAFIDMDLVQNSSKFNIFAGGLAGIISAVNQVVACAAFGSIKTESYAAVVGGFAGFINGNNLDDYVNISKCVSNVDIVVNAGLNVSIGGFVGIIREMANLLNCQAIGSIVLTLGQIDSPLDSAIAVGGFSTTMSPTGQAKECYTTVTVEANSMNGVLAKPFVFGGLVAYLDGTNLISCIVHSNSVKIGPNFSIIYFGGLIGISNRTMASMATSYAVIRNANVAYTASSDTTKVYIGGIAGYAETYFAIMGCFVQMNLTALHSETFDTKFGYVMGKGKSVNINGGSYVAINYTDASGYQLDIAGDDDPTIGITNLFVDCSLVGNKEGYVRCTDDMHGEAFAGKLNGQWRFLKDGDNNNYPAQMYDLYIDRNQAFAKGTRMLGFKDYVLDSQLAFPDWKYDFCYGVCDGEFVSPVNFRCVEGTAYFCMAKDMVARFKQEICSLSTERELCEDGMPTCKPNFDFQPGEWGCSESCRQCEYGLCSNGNCICHYSMAGGACDQFSCSVADPPCGGFGECFGNKCKCDDAQSIYDQSEHVCKVACPNLIPIRGYCVSDGIAVCNSKYSGSQCESCASGLHLISNDCFPNSYFGGIIAAIVIGVLFVVLAAVFAVYVYITCQKKKQAQSLALALAGTQSDYQLMI